jgi:ATP-dependent Lon protease
MTTSTRVRRNLSAIAIRREHEFSIQMRAVDSDKTGTGLGLPVLVSLCGSLLGKNTRGGTIIVGALNLGGSIETIPNAIRIAELAVDKQAQTLLMPVSAETTTE